jgi:hypothetical protein
MEMYHGTKTNAANSIQGPPTNVDVNRGGGEMGQGFYVGDNLTLAISWAKGRYRQPAVLEFQIDKRQYATLSFHRLSHMQVLNTWHQLRRLGTHRTHQFGYDIIFGPLATIPYSAQYKFESNDAQTLLNNSTTNRIL